MPSRIVAAIWLTICYLAGPASAEQACNTHEYVIAALSEQYGEAVRFRGLASGGAVIEILASDKGTWTMIATFPDGRTCLLGTGDAGEFPKAGRAL